MSEESAPGDVGAVLERIRDARFADGIQCPRCDAVRVARWGSFAGRRRYRCGECGRTFSDLTGTPAAYSKKLTLWPAYARCMAQGVSVRAAANRLDIAVSTAFRWRHRILDELWALDAQVLSGIVEIGDLWFAYSRKGERGLTRPGRTRGPRSRTLFPRQLVVRVIVGTDRAGGVVTDYACRTAVGLDDLIETLEGRILHRPTLLAAQGPIGPVARFARRLEGKFVEVRRDVAFRPGTLWHLRTMQAYSRRLLVWIERFRGVATKYLDNYLVWHRIVDAAERLDPARVVLAWALRSGFT